MYVAPLMYFVYVLAFICVDSSSFFFQANALKSFELHLLGPPGGAAPPHWFMAQNADAQQLRVHQGTNSTVIVLSRSPSTSVLSTSGSLTKSLNLDGGASSSSSSNGGDGQEMSGSAVVNQAWARGAWLRLCAHSLAPLALLLRRSGSLEQLVVQTLVPGLGLLANDCPTAAVPYGFGGGESAALAIASSAAATDAAAAATDTGDVSTTVAQASGTELPLAESASSSSTSAGKDTNALALAPIPSSVVEPLFPRDQVEIDLAYEAAKTALARAACPAEHGHRPWGVKLRVNDATHTALPWFVQAFKCFSKRDELSRLFLCRCYVH